ncbi:MAG: (2Fe-2S)-binding protein [Chitinispirillaceae bacterium]|nr:(2Fe-2S)-binding protein [Chitinispirillaceae bacterium]
MGTVAMKIDGKNVTADEGKTILQAALAAGIDIPHMCYLEQLEPYGACRLCMVEVTANKRTRMVASCAYPVKEGLEVKTDSEALRKVRKLLVELLWPLAPELAEKYGITASRFSNDHTDCSMCGKCVRYCSEIKKKEVLYFKGRGIEREIAAVPELVSECVYCQECFKECNGGLILKQAGMPWA